MIVVDTSSLARIALREKDHERHRLRLSQSQTAFIPVAAYLEFNLLTHLGPERRAWIDSLIAGGTAKLAASEADDAMIAADAAVAYGKGSGHPAQLNFGDCLVYAVAKRLALPLLFAGDDFSRTDILPALD